MKILDLAFKDLTRSFRSIFAVLFMFGIPLLMAGMFYFMFGGMKDDSGISLPQTAVVIANLDEGGVDLNNIMSQLPGETETRSMGEIVVRTLQDPSLADLMSITLVEGEAAARAAVDAQQAGMAIIIPADFTRQFSSLEGETALQVYQDPTLTLGPAIVRSVLNQFIDGLSGAKIAVEVALAQTGSSDPAFIGRVFETYLTSLQATQDPASLLTINNFSTADEQLPLVLRIVGPIMGGMMIFYAYYTATATAQTLLQEDENGTLPRLFTTPTPQATILGGKFLAVLLTVSTQVIVLLLLGRLIFGITWGSPLNVIMVAIGTILTASSFGVFVNSFMKSTKQGGVLFGGILTFSGMLGMLPIFLISASAPPMVKTISLFVPQGWAVEVLLRSMQGGQTTNLVFPGAVLIAWSVVMFVIGAWKFQKRYA